MPVLVISGAPGADTDMLCYMLDTSSEVPLPDDAVADAVLQAAGDLGGRYGETAMVANPARSPPRILLAGLGDRQKTTPDTLRYVAGVVAKRARGMRIRRLAFVCPSQYGLRRSVSGIVEGCMLSLYDFDRYKSKKEAPAPDVTVISDDDISGMVETARAAADGVLFARGIANLPPNDCPPAALAKHAENMAEECGLKYTTLSGPQLSEFGGICAVGQGSSNDPRLIVLEYEGGRGRPVALVGKAVTFDTGGISLKPGERMDEMKFDKCGGCTVMGIMRAAAQMRLPVNIVGIIPSVENMPGGSSYRPGDIIRLYSGKTAEILNTDAEGRLILADALAYAQEKFSPRAVIDFATLTGACIIALGCDVAGMVSNDDTLADAIYESSKRTSEPVWRLPLNDDYTDMIKSKVADIKNLGNGRAAGTITAAAFLASSIGEVPWVHLDIAGTAWMQPPSKKRSYNPPGATGFGVRLILDYLGGL